MKHIVAWEIKDGRGRLIEQSKIFDTVASACSFFREIKSKSVTKPIITTLVK